MLEITLSSPVAQTELSTGILVFTALKLKRFGGRALDYYWQTDGKELGHWSFSDFCGFSTVSAQHYLGQVLLELYWVWGAWDGMGPVLNGCELTSDCVVICFC